MAGNCGCFHTTEEIITASFSVGPLMQPSTYKLAHLKGSKAQDRGGVIRFDLLSGRTAAISGGYTFQGERSASLSMLEAVVVGSGHVGNYINRKVLN